MTEGRCSMNFLIIWCHWHLHHHHVMQKALLMAPLHSLDQDDKNEVQHDFIGYVTPLAPASASHDADGIVNSTTTFLCLDEQSQVQNDFLVMLYHWCQCQCHLMSMASLYFLVNMTEVKCNMTFLVIPCHWHWYCHHMMLSAFSVTITFFRSGH